MSTSRARQAGLAFALTLLLLLGAVPAVHALEPTESFYVNDYVGILSNRDRDYLVQRARTLRSQNGVQIVVVIVDNYIGESLEKYANQIYNEFGIGSKQYDNGALLIVAVDDGEVRIEVGDGLSGQIPDSFAGRILDDYFMPHAERGDLDRAVYQTFLKLIQEGSRLNTPGEPNGPGDSGNLFVGLLGLALMVGALVGIVVLLRRAGRRQPPAPPYYGGPSQGYPYGPGPSAPQSPTQGPQQGPLTGGPFYPYGGAPDFRLPRRVFFPFGGGTTPTQSPPGYGGNQADQSRPQTPPASGGGGRSAGGGAKRSFPASPSGRTGGSPGRSSTPRTIGRSPFSGGGSRPSTGGGGSFGGGGRSTGGGGRSAGGGASRGFKR